VLKDATLPEQLLADADEPSGPTSLFGQIAGSPGRFVGLFADARFRARSTC
jgi:hypothetical protein